MNITLKKLLSSLWQDAFFLIIWCGFLSSYNMITVLSGVCVIVLISMLFGFSSQKLNPFYCLVLVFYITYELFVSSYYVIAEILKSSDSSKYSVISITIDGLTVTQQVILANLVSLTPGTLTIDVSDSVLTIHDMFSFKEDDISESISNTLIPMIKKAFPC